MASFEFVSGHKSKKISLKSSQPRILTGKQKRKLINVIIWKSCVETTDLEINMEEVVAAVNTIYAVVKIKPEKFRSYGIWIHELWNTVAVLYQLS